MPPQIFIGSSSEAGDQAEHLGNQLQEALGDQAKINFWQDAALFEPGNVLFQRLVDLAGETDFAILVLTPTARFDGQVAPNVLFELGLFMGQLERYRTIVVIHDDIEPPSDLQGLLYLRLGADDVVEQIVRRVGDYGERVNPEIEMGALERMLNVCTPAYLDHDAPHLQRVKSQKEEQFQSAGDFFELTRCLLRRYIIASMPPASAAHLRAYLAVYLGDGVSMRGPGGEDSVVESCRSEYPEEGPAPASFIIALSNPGRLAGEGPRDNRLGRLVENDWLLAQPVPGYFNGDMSRPDSTCAKAFVDQRERLGRSGESWNQSQDGEVEVLAVPVLWRQDSHAASIGVLALSCDEDDLEHRHLATVQRLRLVANVLGVAADRLGHSLAPPQDSAVGLHIDHAVDSRSFARRAIEMRRTIGAFALGDLQRQRLIDLVVGEFQAEVVQRPLAGAG